MQHIESGLVIACYMLHAFPRQPKEVHASPILNPNKSTYNLKL